jgi:hypothetical protein
LHLFRGKFENVEGVVVVSTSIGGASGEYESSTGNLIGFAYLSMGMTAQQHVAPFTNVVKGVLPIPVRMDLVCV